MDHKEILKTISRATNLIDAAAMIMNLDSGGISDDLMEVIAALKKEWEMED